MTRAMVAQVLYQFNGTPEVSGDPVFKDVTAGKWYYNAAQWAGTNGIIAGIAQRKFAPEQKVTREQFATMLYRYMKEPAVTGNLDAYPDAAKVSSWAKNAMIWAVENGLISGSKTASGLELQPDKNMSRAQAASILDRFTDWYEKQPKPEPETTPETTPEPEAAPAA